MLNKRPILAQRRPFLLNAGLVSGFTLLTAVIFRTSLPALRTALIGPPEDNLNDFWNALYAVKFVDFHHVFFTGVIRFPEGTPLLYQSFAYPKLAAIALICRLAGGDAGTLILLENLSILISFPLAGLGAFHFVRRFTGSDAGALFGAVVFAFNPSHVAHAEHHIGVSSIEFLPVFALAYLAALDRRSWALLAAAIGLYLLAALSTWYYLFYCAYFVIFHTIYLAIANRAIPKGWALLAPSVCLGGAAVVLSPLLLPMARAAFGGPSVYEVGGDFYTADLVALIAAPPGYLLGHFNHKIYDSLTGTAWEAVVYLGAVNIYLLGLPALIGEKQDRRILAYVLAGMATFYVLAAGDSLHFVGHSLLPLPDAALEQLPFFGNVRTPSRAIVFVYLFLAIGVGQAVKRILALGSAKARLAVWAAGVLTAIDFLPMEALPITPLSCAPGFALIRDDPERGFGVLALPSGRPAGYLQGSYYMAEQVCHGRPIVQGTTARDVVVTLRDRIESRDLARQQPQLAAAHVKYVVIHRTRYPWAPEDGRYDQYLHQYAKAYEDPDILILKVY